MDPDDQQPKKITLANFFESIKDTNVVAQRALKLSSGLGKTIEKTTETVEVNKKDISELQKTVETISKDVNNITDYIQEQQERRSRELDKREDEIFEKEDKLQKESKAGESQTQSSGGGGGGDSLSAAGAALSSGLGVGLMGLNAFTAGRGFGGSVGGIIDALTGNVTDFDRRGGETGGPGGVLAGMVDFFTLNAFNLDKKGSTFMSKEKLEELERRKRNRKNKTENLDEFYDSYDKGGYVEKDGPAIIHEGEFVSTKNTVDKMGTDFFEGLGKIATHQKEHDDIPFVTDPELKALIMTVRNFEGTSGEGAFSRWFGDRNDITGMKYGDITDKTIQEVYDLQTLFLKDPQSKFTKTDGTTDRSAAVGVGQFVFLRSDAQRLLGVDPNTQKFTPEFQIRLMEAQIKERIGKDPREKITDKDFKTLGKLYASFDPYYKQTDRDSSEVFQYYNSLLTPSETKPKRSLASKALGVLDAITGNRFDFDNLGKGVTPDVSDSNQNYSVDLAQNPLSSDSAVEIMEAINIDSGGVTSDGTGSTIPSQFDVASTGSPVLIDPECPFDICNLKRDKSNKAFV